MISTGGLQYAIPNVDLQNWQFTTCPRTAMKSSVAPHDGHECTLISDFPFGTQSVIEHGTFASGRCMNLVRVLSKSDIKIKPYFTGSAHQHVVGLSWTSIATRKRESPSFWPYGKAPI